MRENLCCSCFWKHTILLMRLMSSGSLSHHVSGTFAFYWVNVWRPFLQWPPHLNPGKCEKIMHNLFTLSLHWVTWWSLQWRSCRNCFRALAACLCSHSSPSLLDLSNSISIWVWYLLWGLTVLSSCIVWPLEGFWVFLEECFCVLTRIVSVPEASGGPAETDENLDARCSLSVSSPFIPT